MTKITGGNLLDRRKFVQSTGALGLTAFVPKLLTEAHAKAPGLQDLIGTQCPPLFVGEGPYYPALDSIAWGSDLTTVPGKRGVASGQILYVFGQVTTSACMPLGGVQVELWQSDKDGRYNHPTAKRFAGSDEIDPHFRYFGKVITQLDGYYLFKTILPKWYVVFGFKRCAHIHFRISHRDYGTVVTQMMFEGKEDDKIRLEDQEYLKAPPHVRKKIVVAKQKPLTFPEMAKRLRMEESVQVCRFDQAFI
jgi:protocatechuate 3,4-dioxygenase beta subunit